jgi:hypothetical protein
MPKSQFSPPNRRRLFTCETQPKSSNNGIQKYRTINTKLFSNIMEDIKINWQASNIFPDFWNQIPCRAYALLLNDPSRSVCGGAH